MYYWFNKDIIWSSPHCNTYLKISLLYPFFSPFSSLLFGENISLPPCMTKHLEMIYAVSLGTWKADEVQEILFLLSLWEIREQEKQGDSRRSSLKKPEKHPEWNRQECKIEKDQMYHWLVLQCFLSPGLHPTFVYKLAGFTTDRSSLLFYMHHSFHPNHILLCRLQKKGKKQQQQKRTQTQPLNYGWVMFLLSILYIDLFFPSSVAKSTVRP